MEDEARNRRYLRNAERDFDALESWKTKLTEKAEKWGAKANQAITSLDYVTGLLNLICNIFLLTTYVNLDCGKVKYMIWFVVAYLLLIGLPIGSTFVKLQRIFKSMEDLRKREKLCDNALFALLVRVQLREAHLIRPAEMMPPDAVFSERIQTFIDEMGFIDVTKFKWHYYYHLTFIVVFTIGYAAALAFLAYFKFCVQPAPTGGGGGRPIIPLLPAFYPFKMH